MLRGTWETGMNRIRRFLGRIACFFGLHDDDETFQAVRWGSVIRARMQCARCGRKASWFIAGPILRWNNHWDEFWTFYDSGVIEAEELQVRKGQI